MSLCVAGMLFEQIEQHGARFIAIAFQAVNARQIQVRLIEGRARPGCIARNWPQLHPCGAFADRGSEIIQRLRIIRGEMSMHSCKYW